MHGAHVPRKRFGQHFLHERGVIERILRALQPAPGDRFVEIGPGEGALTLPLLAEAGRLTAIELDRDLIPILRERARDIGALELIEADALTVDFTALAGDGALRLVGNLPYNISTPLLFHALSHAGAIRDMLFMLQKEVVQRMAAAHGSKTYGRLSVSLQSRCRVEHLFDVAPGSFRPPPKVDSAIVRVVPLDRPLLEPSEQDALDRLLRAAFAQRRKTLRNALRGLADDTTLEACGIDPGVRAEDVPVARYVALARHAGSASAP